MMQFLPLVMPLFKQVASNLFPDKIKQDEAMQQFMLTAMTTEGQQILKQMESQAAVILAEANGESWLQRNWRPITMLCFVGIVVNNYMIYPYLSLFWSEAPKMILPSEVWELIKIGLGGYVVGRSVEKTAKVLSDNKALPWQNKDQ